MKYARKPTICVIGLGYVGLPLAYFFAKKKFTVYGYDRDSSRINDLRKHHDATLECTKKQLQEVSIEYSDNPAIIKKANFLIVAVPTPVTADKLPDLRPLISVSQTIGENMLKNSVVVFESTVYPGATEEECVPVIEQYSGLKCGKDWVVGYSPERINPGDKVHTPETIVKITAGMNQKCAHYIDSTYKTIIKAGTFLAKDIRTAEAAKVIENTQRDMNIAIINEFSKIFHALGLDTQAVLEAAGTKWNFLHFKPGLVGGHCISVDPYYLIHKSQKEHYHPRLLIESRLINDSMARFSIDRIVETIIKHQKIPQKTKLLVMGATFKENVPDFRNSMVKNLIQSLERKSISYDLIDPFIQENTIPPMYRNQKKSIIFDFSSSTKYDGIIYAVNHESFYKLSMKKLNMLCKKNPFIFDITSSLKKKSGISMFDYHSL